MLGLVLRTGALLTAIGIALGLAGAAAAARFLQGMLFGITPTDPLTFVIVTGALAVTALIASFWPALRATRVDPVKALIA